MKTALISALVIQQSLENRCVLFSFQMTSLIRCTSEARRMTRPASPPLKWSHLACASAWKSLNNAGKWRQKGRTEEEQTMVVRISVLNTVLTSAKRKINYHVITPAYSCMSHATSTSSHCNLGRNRRDLPSPVFNDEFALKRVIFFSISEFFI